MVLCFSYVKISHIYMKLGSLTLLTTSFLHTPSIQHTFELARKKWSGGPLRPSYIGTPNLSHFFFFFSRRLNWRWKSGCLFCEGLFLCVCRYEKGSSFSPLFSSLLSGREINEPWVVLRGAARYSHKTQPDKKVLAKSSALAKHYFQC